MGRNSFDIKEGFRFSGEIEKAGSGLVKISLNADSLARLEKSRGCAVVECTEGVLWVTQQKDFADYLLHKGERLRINTHGLVMITALTDAKVEVRAE
ncbi:MAG: DUF2917 domain-containing protein [Nitrospirae bacterium]|nr:MAG: DUF2917 domain-containing protein [Nitrospirota bacterium]